MILADRTLDAAGYLADYLGPTFRQPATVWDAILANYGEESQEFLKHILAIFGHMVSRQPVVRRLIPALVTRGWEGPAAGLIITTILTEPDQHIEGLWSIIEIWKQEGCGEVLDMVVRDFRNPPGVPNTDALVLRLERLAAICSQSK